jgi:uncharacterized membrane protein
MRSSRQRGFVLIAMSITMLLLLAVMGMAFDLGRIYIARNEAQVFTDAAAMTAASKLDGTAAGIERAREAVKHLPMRWNLGTQEFTGVVIEFGHAGSQGDAAQGNTPGWERDPSDAAHVTMARVTAPSNDVEITFLRAVGGPRAFTVPASATASSNPVRVTE